MNASDVLTFLNPEATITSKLISAGAVLLAGATAVGVLYYVIIAGPQHDRVVAAQATAGAAVAQGDAAAAKAAVAVVAAQNTRDAVSDQTTKDNSDAITKAAGSTTRVDPNVDLAGRLSLCRRKAYSGSAQCRALLKAHS